MGHLAERMNARIGASGALPRRRARQQTPLLASVSTLCTEDAIILHLPAYERRAVIFDGKLVAGQGWLRSRTLRAPLSACRAGTHPPASACRRLVAVRRTAPNPVAQAIVSLSSSTLPGCPFAVSLRCAQNFHPPTPREIHTTRREMATVRGNDCEPPATASSSGCASRPCPILFAVSPRRLQLAVPNATNPRSSAPSATSIRVAPRWANSS